MKFNNTLTLLFLLLTPFVWAQENPLKIAISNCREISDSQDRLRCYDLLNAEKTTPVVEQIDAINQPKKMPVLLADLEEPRIFSSLGRMDFLDRQFSAILMGIGTRLKLKSFEFNNKKDSIDFNFIGLIKSQFDVDELSTRNNRGGALINTDFMMGGELVKSYDFGHLRLKYTHRSTHLGDEFLIDNPEYLKERLNLSYETVDLLAYRNFDKLGGYFGVSAIVRSEPGDLKNFQLQSGLQYHGDPGEWLTPIFGLDFKSWQATNWQLNTSIKAGFEYTGFLDKPLQIMLEYYQGKSPYGQFINDDLDYVGLSINHYW